MKGQDIQVPINESVVYDDIATDKTALFSMLLTTGYLTTANTPTELPNSISLKIPNEEIRQLYKTEIMNHMISHFTQYEFDYMFTALVSGNKEDFAEYLRTIIEQSVSSFDTGSHECFYHALLLGMLAGFNGPKYQILSNREAGFGRFDIAIVPNDNTLPGVILELKYADNETALPQKAKEALAQIHAKAYDKYPDFHGVKTIWHYGIAFHGKHLYVEMD